jgi:hypothetical protein
MVQDALGITAFFPRVAEGLLLADLLLAVVSRKSSSQASPAVPWLLFMSLNHRGCAVNALTWHM